MKQKKAAKVSNVEKFLDHKRKKRWEDTKSGSIFFMVYARDLFITWGTREYWIWNCYKETGEEKIEVAKLSHICWLDVRGKLKVSELSPKMEYEIAYIVKLTKMASGWEIPVTLRLRAPDGKLQHRLVSLLEKPRGEWFEIVVGTFESDGADTREVCFDMYEHDSGRWKIGLIVKGAIIRPKLIMSY